MVPRSPGELGDEDAVRSGTMILTHSDRIERAYGNSKSAGGSCVPMAWAFQRTERYDRLGVNELHGGRSQSLVQAQA